MIQNGTKIERIDLEQMALHLSRAYAIEDKQKQCQAAILMVLKQAEEESAEAMRMVITERFKVGTRAWTLAAGTSLDLAARVGRS